jgi:hypothetical protein
MASYPGWSEPGPSTAPDVAEAREKVVGALRSMERGERNSLDGMREALCAFVTALKTDGATREQAIEAVRDVISQPASEDGGFRLLPPAREALVELSLYWCTEEFGRA